MNSRFADLEQPIEVAQAGCALQRAIIFSYAQERIWDATERNAWA